VAKRLAFLAILSLFAPLSTAHAGKLIVIANPSIGDVTALSLKEVAAIYLLRVTTWPDGARIVPVNREVGSDQRMAFSSDVLKQDFASLSAYWNEMHFQGKLPPLVQESEPAVLAFVQRVPGAVGYISEDTPAIGVKVLAHVP
jgi:ABC-type phosphate transport system substrate-binding protein